MENTSLHLCRVTVPAIGRDSSYASSHQMSIIRCLRPGRRLATPFISGSAVCSWPWRVIGRSLRFRRVSWSG